MQISVTEAQYDPLIGEMPTRDLAMRGAYDASSQSMREMSLWTSPLQSADMDILPDKLVMDSRVRDTLRNDSYVQNGATIQKDSIVGELFLLNAKPNHKVLGLDEVWAEEFQEEVEAKFTLYAESIRNFPDAARKLTLTGMVRLAVGVHAMAGEVLASVEWMRNGYRPYRTALQMLDVDRLGNPNGEMDSPILRGGVQRDRFGAPLGYWIREAHPGDWMNPDGYTWKYVPATRGQVTGNAGWDRPQMIHIVDQWRPDQSRGIAAMVSALKEMRMTKKFRDVVLQSAVLNASYAASIESDLPSDVALAQAGGGDRAALADYASTYLGEVAKYVGGSRNIHLDGVKIPVFYPGTKMKLQSAGTPGGVGSDFEASMLRYISASLGVSYSQLSKDYSAANYSSLRADLAEVGKRMRVQKRQVADRFASTFYRLWLEEALNKGDITAMPRKAPNWYDGLNQEAYCVAEWIGASTGQIDELKETQAAVLRVNNGLSTREDELAKLGKDWRVVFQQLSREKKAAEKHELEFGADKSSQNQMNAASGTPSSTGDGPRSADKEEDTDE
ncbi:phage portal protein [Pseudomonas stutzeri]|uniref:phage portal protein n=1 Tax=Stutzerimonas stutzeri TaxID=316 RepID=UPI00210D586E|nr:phage portal protein [Stutzerimonas stutzeri]MCQ4311701.1 phage portal protein [Stutzerimonas stutzeri]